MAEEASQAVDRFSLAIHRAGNHRRHVEQLGRWADALPLAKSGLALGPELDLKWLDEGGRLHLYAYHGPQMPGLRWDLLRSGRILAQKQRAGELWVLDDGALADFPQLHFFFELKSGIGALEAALDALWQQLQEAGAHQRAMFLSNDLPRAAACRRHLPQLPVATMHGLATTRGVFHQADYAPFQSWKQAGLFVAYDALPGTHVVASLQDPGPIYAASKAYFAHRVRRFDQLQAARERGASGAFLYVSMEHLEAILRRCLHPQ